MRAAVVLVALGWLAGCREETKTAAAPAPAAAPAAAPAPSLSLPCVDRWLSAQHLNEFGDPPGTLYAGGTPLFDEATGARRDRLALLARKHPALVAACSSPDAGR